MSIGNILIVEDERVLCDTIARSLRRLAYSVDCCYDGQSAAEMLAVERFDLVVLDLNLPGEDGMTVLRTLRERDRDTKVLILSARCEVADKVAGLDAGANDYLTKPFHLDELAARIRSRFEPSAMLPAAGQGALGIDGQEGVNVGVHLFDAIKTLAGDLFGALFPGGDPAAEFGCGLGDRGRHHCSRSKMRGTRN